MAEYTNEAMTETTNEGFDNDGFDDGLLDDEVNSTDDDIFDEADTTDTETEDTAEATEPVEEVAEVEPVAEQPNFADLEIKYNGVSSKLSDYEPDVIVANFQKGMNYDKLKADFDAVQSSPYMELVNEWAKENNMTPDEWAEAVRVQTLAETKGYTLEDAKAMLDAQKIKKEQEAEQARIAAEEQRKADEEAAKQEADTKMYTKFLAKYPTIDVTTIPKEVWDAVNQGEDLTAAYAEYRLQQIEQQNKIKEQNQTNKQKAMGSVQSENNANADPFLSGLFG